MSQALIVGIDVSKKDLASASRGNGVEAEQGKFKNEPGEFDSLSQALNAEREKQGLTQIHLIVEATGGYEAHLLEYAYAQGWLVSMPNPKQVRDWAKGVGYRAKTDRVDARILAHYGAERKPPVRPQLAKEVANLDSLLKRRLELEQALHTEETRLSEMSGRPGLDTEVEASFKQVIKALTTALEKIQEAIDKLTKSHEPFKEAKKRLLPLPGVGKKVVLPLMVKLFQWHNITSGEGDAKGLVSFIGLDPQSFESGTSVHKRSGISKMGDSELRRLLYMGALGGVRGNNPLKSFYQRLVGNDKAKKVALVASARKILVWAWTIFSRNTDWNPDFHKIGA